MASFGVPSRRFSPSLLPPREHTHFSDYVVFGLFIEPCDLTQILLRFPNCPARFDSPQELSIAREELPRKRPRSSLCRNHANHCFRTSLNSSHLAPWALLYSNSFRKALLSAMTPRRSSRARTSQPSPALIQQTNSSSSSSSTRERSTRSNHKNASPHESSGHRSQSIDDA